MKVKELIEKLQEFDEDMEVFYDDEHYGPVDVTELYKATIYKQFTGIGGYHYTKMEGDEEIRCVYIE